jgi:Tol biopolymer transport system component
MIARLFLAAALVARGTLVFVANVSGNWELFALHAGHDAPERLTDTALDERAPSLSPDGKRVAYATSDGGLWVMTLADKAAARLALPAGIYGYPAWLPDGSGIAYTAYEYGPRSEDADLYVYHFATATVAPLILQTGPQDFVAMSPDGQRIAYIASTATTVAGLGSHVTQQLWVVSLRTGAASPLFRGNWRDTRPAWSPDGKRLAISSDRSGNPEIWITDPEGRNSVQLTSGPGAKSSPAWSPEGAEIAYVSLVEGKSQLEIADVKTKRHRALMRFEVRDPAWR